MASEDKDLECRLIGVGRRLTSPPSATADLLTLLDQTHILLSRVDQSPPKSIFAALRPARNSLVGKTLTTHFDMDVRVAAASCICELTRITAPDAPYSSAQMKRIFVMIVEAFDNLDDISSRSFSKRVSILETVSRVGTCVLMMDLDCDALILDMFRCFLRTIRSNHRGVVFSSMESIMTLVLEGCSNGIFRELIACLVGCVKMDDKDILPIARRLAGNVISNCARMLKLSVMRVRSDRSSGRQCILEADGHPQEPLNSDLESINKMMKLVELHEEKAKEAKVEVSKACQDILSEVEELRQTMKRDEEANDVHARKIYAEKAILVTEARELLTRFLNFPEQRNISPLVTQEIFHSLETRLIAAEAELAAAEQEKLEKEEWGHKLLKGQQLLMENMVEQSHMLKKEEEENAEFREILTDGGRILDQLQESRLDREFVLSSKKRIGDKCRRLTDCYQ